MKKKVCFLLSLILIMSALSTTSFSSAIGYMGFSGDKEINSSTLEVSVMLLCTDLRGGECTITFDPRQLSVANVKYNTLEGFYYSHSQAEGTLTLLFYTDEEQSGLLMPFTVEFFILGGIEGDGIHLELTDAVITNGYVDTVLDDSSYDGILKTFVAPVETEPPATTVTEPPQTTTVTETKPETETQTDTETETQTEQTTQGAETQTETETEPETTEAVTGAITTDGETPGGGKLNILPFIIGAAVLAAVATLIIILLKRKRKSEDEARAKAKGRPQGKAKAVSSNKGANPQGKAKAVSSNKVANPQGKAAKSSAKKRKTK